MDYNESAVAAARADDEFDLAAAVGALDLQGADSDSSDATTDDNATDDDATDDADDPAGTYDDLLAAQRALNNKGEATRTTPDGKRHRRDVSCAVKRFAARLQAEQLPFAEIQKRVFHRSRGVAFLSSQRQLSQWVEAATAPNMIGSRRTLHTVPHG